MARFIDAGKIKYRREYGGEWITNKEEVDIVPTADVVERKKIDKAIEEIEQEIQNGTIKISSGNEKLFNILKEI